jgi:hypothetical protein
VHFRIGDVPAFVVRPVMVTTPLGRHEPSVALACSVPSS